MRSGIIQPLDPRIRCLRYRSKLYLPCLIKRKGRDWNLLGDLIHRLMTIEVRYLPVSFDTALMIFSAPMRMSSTQFLRNCSLLGAGNKLLSV